MYLESDDARDLKKAQNIFTLEADYIDRFKGQKTKLMSLQRFTLVCLDNGLFENEEQEELLKSDHKKLLRNVKQHWTDIKREMKLRLIYTDSYHIKE